MYERFVCNAAGDGALIQKFSDANCTELIIEHDTSAIAGPGGSCIDGGGFASTHFACIAGEVVGTFYADSADCSTTGVTLIAAPGG